MVRVIHKGKLLCRNKEYELVYRRGKLYIFLCKSKELLFVYTLYGFFKTVLSKLRLFDRLLRLEPRCAVAISDDIILVSCDGRILRVDVRLSMVTLEHEYVKGMNNPLCFCIRNVSDGIEVIYGEYGWNVARKEVGIWKRKNETWERVGCFPEKTIKHIHQIVFDSFRNEYLIATGDSDSESGIWKMDINFKNIEPILYGCQQCRSCAVFPMEEGFLFATDTPLADNHLYFFTHADRTVRDLAKMPGPCIYAREFEGTYFFATSVEPDSSLSTWRFRFTKKIGAGVSDYYTHILCYRRNTLCEVGKFKKDMLPMWLFQFGNCQFPMIQDDSAGLFITPIAVKKYDNYTLKLFFDKEE